MFARLAISGIVRGRKALLGCDRRRRIDDPFALAFFDLPHAADRCARWVAGLGWACWARSEDNIAGTLSRAPATGWPTSSSEYTQSDSSWPSGRACPPAPGAPCWRPSRSRGGRNLADAAEHTPGQSDRPGRSRALPGERLEWRRPRVQSTGGSPVCAAASGLLRRRQGRASEIACGLGAPPVSANASLRASSRPYRGPKSDVRCASRIWPRRCAARRPRRWRGKAVPYRRRGCRGSAVRRARASERSAMRTAG